MCYLKNLSPSDTLDSQFWNHKDEETYEPAEDEVNVLVPCVEKCMGAEWSKDEQMLVKIFEMVDRNNRLIFNMNKMINKNSQQVGNFDVKNQIFTSFNFPAACSLNEHNSTQQKSLSQEESLCQKLFGHKNYKFELQPNDKFEETIYKQRNFGLKVKLTGAGGKPVRNCNLITLCFAMCTIEGEWLHQNRVGQAFMKGKTEVELYRGEAYFEKLYAREISRVYPQGKVAIIIYAKPSIVKYTSMGPTEEPVSSEDIKPLILNNISIKAKRKQ